MKVLVWSQYFWPENFRINELVVELRKKGLELSVLTGKPNYPAGKLFQGYKSFGVQYETYADSEVVRIPLLPRGSSTALGLLVNYLSFILSGFLVAPFALKKRNFDVVFVYAPSPLLQALPAIFISWLKGAPLVVWVQDLWPESLVATGFIKNRLLIKTVEFLVKFIYERSDSILIQSEAFRRPVARLVSNVSKIQYYPNTAEIATATSPRPFEYDKCVSEIRNYFSVVFTGNVGVAQSIETVVGAAEILMPEKQVRFFVIGGGSREAWLKQEISRRTLTNITIVDRLPYNLMPEIFDAASALLLTLKRDDTFSKTVPSKLQAYLLAGKPVIACADGEAARIVNEANAGFFCPAEDCNALAKAILQLTEMSKQECATLGNNGRRYFDDHFEPSRRLSELVEHFKNLSAMKEGNS